MHLWCVSANTFNLSKTGMHRDVHLPLRAFLVVVAAVVMQEFWRLVLRDHSCSAEDRPWVSCVPAREVP